MNKYICHLKKETYFWIQSWDVNECANNADNDCDANADCFDTKGGYTCTCADGYDGCEFVDDSGGLAGHLGIPVAGHSLQSQDVLG